MLLGLFRIDSGFVVFISLSVSVQYLLLLPFPRPLIPCVYRFPYSLPPPDSYAFLSPLIGITSQHNKIDNKMACLNGMFNLLCTSRLNEVPLSKLENIRIILFPIHELSVHVAFKVALTDDQIAFTRLS